MLLVPKGAALRPGAVVEEEGEGADDGGARREGVDGALDAALLLVGDLGGDGADEQGEGREGDDPCRGGDYSLSPPPRGHESKTTENWQWKMDNATMKDNGEQGALAPCSPGSWTQLKAGECIRHVI